MLFIAEPELVLALNAVTFAISTLLMTRLRGHVAPIAVAEDEDEVPSHLLGVLKDRFIRSLVLTSGAVMLVATMILRPVRPASPIGPPSTNLPVGLTSSRKSEVSRCRGSGRRERC